MHRLLTRGGIIVTVMSPAWQYRIDRKHKDFGTWLKTLQHKVEDLPEGTFKVSGTHVRALLVTIRRDRLNA